MNDANTRSEEIYGCEQTFERMFLGALFGNSAPHFIAGWKSDFKDQVGFCCRKFVCSSSSDSSQIFIKLHTHVQDENTRAMVFYLQHATDARLSFPAVANGGDRGGGAASPVLRRRVK